MASMGVSAPAIAAAVISPTECPATYENDPAAPSACALMRPVATMSG